MTDSGETKEKAPEGRTDSPEGAGSDPEEGLARAEGSPPADEPAAAGGEPSGEGETPGAGDGAPVAPAAEADEGDPLLAELEELRDRHLRLAAEFENYRKRTRKELLKTREAGKAELAGSLLDAMDDLGRLAAISTDSTTVEALHEGIELVERKLVKQLREAGLAPIEAEGEPFDPNLHEALTTVPTDRPEEDDTVSRVFVPGYRFGDRLLRPARVEVRKYAGGGEGQEPREPES